MYNKIKNFSKKCWDDMNMLRITAVTCILWIIATFVLITVQKNWDSMFIYPDEDYKVIQKEANRIITTHNFDTSYQLTITNYSNVYHSLSFELRNDSGTMLTAFVDNYGLENQSISYKRMDNNPITHILKNIFILLLLVPIFLGVISTYAILIVISIFWLIAFIIHKIINAIK